MSLTGLAFAALFLAGNLLALARHPIYGLATYVGVFYLHPPSHWWGAGLPDLRWSLLPAAVTLIGMLLHAKKLQPRGSFLQHLPVKALLVLVVWMAVQMGWAMSIERQIEIVVLYLKYIVLLYVMYRVIDSEQNLRIFLWIHVLGCFAQGWIAYSDYSGGRFEGFRGPNISEANAGALMLVTGALAAGALFLSGTVKERIALIGVLPFIVNGVITAISRSGFLALGTGALIFNFFTPRFYRTLVRVLSLLAVIMFLMLTNPVFWERIHSLTVAGEQIENVDTGYKRLVLIQAQWKMFLANPLGSGHKGTAYLSPAYLPESQLTGEGDDKARSSHNTFMTMLTEHSIVGAVVYIVIVLWIARSVFKLWPLSRDKISFTAVLLPAVAAILGANVVGDMFVDYIKLEIRMWFIAVLMIMLDWARVAAPARTVKYRARQRKATYPQGTLNSPVPSR